MKKKLFEEIVRKSEKMSGEVEKTKRCSLSKK
jgi:hypothetical protein